MIGFWFCNTVNRHTFYICHHLFLPGRLCIFIMFGVHVDHPNDIYNSMAPLCNLPFGLSSLNVKVGEARQDLKQLSSEARYRRASWRSTIALFAAWLAKIACVSPEAVVDAKPDARCGDVTDTVS